MAYKIYDTKLKLYTRGTYKLRRVAQHKADRLDNDYGAYRYYVHEIRDIVPVIYATENNIYMMHGRA